jgi:hypothetical protein
MPATAGVKETVTWQDAFAVRGAEQIFASEKLPVELPTICTELIDSGPLPTLLRPTVIV